MRKYIYIIVLLIILGSSISVIIHYKNKGAYCQEALENIINEQNSRIDNRIEAGGNDQIASFYDTDIMLNPHLMLTSIDGKKQELKDLPGKGKKLMYYFSMQNCLLCVKHILPSLKQLADEVGTEKVICLVNSHSRREVSLFNRDNELNIPVYLPYSIGLSLEKENIPFFFVIDEDLKTGYVYIPREEMSVQTTEYLDLMKHVLLNQPLHEK
ncbi:TlpA family protein disulfide reductase [Parabacteroides pacaensis]|uniref:TlpA family protein disulfide reductase n=1 Tax=Parabacteroides pacaensis TaxID=2086575 RepID=UPI000D0F8AB9|nr:hypothetical protein [Parabacteroides pacaensis]